MRFADLDSSIISGRILSIEFNPNNPQIIYILSQGGGVWKSTDAGTHWNPITDTLSSLNGGDIAIDPNHPDILY